MVDSGKLRETSPWREFFYEELIKAGILDKKKYFPYIFHNYLGRRWAAIRHSPHSQLPEILVADVYELLPTPDQLQELKRIRSSSPSTVAWVKEDQIARGGAIPGATQTISIASPVSQWIT